MAQRNVVHQIRRATQKRYSAEDKIRIVEQFATHMAAIAKRLEENPDTGAQRYAYVRSGADHFSMAFTYDVIAWERDEWASQPYIEILGEGLGGGGPWIPPPAKVSEGSSRDSDRAQTAAWGLWKPPRKRHATECHAP
jgi:hypothetical protein